MKTYIYKGQKVFLEYINDMQGIEPIASDGVIGAYPVESHNGSSTCLTTDDIYDGCTDEDQEIVLGNCRNPENDQRMIYAWWTKFYAEADEVERQLCVQTTRYYGWTSELTNIIAKIENWQNTHDSDASEEYREDWKDTCKEYLDKVSPDNPIVVEVPSFDEVMDLVY